MIAITFYSVQHAMIPESGRKPIPRDHFRPGGTSFHRTLHTFRAIFQRHCKYRHFDTLISASVLTKPHSVRFRNNSEWKNTAYIALKHAVSIYRNI